MPSPCTQHEPSSNYWALPVHSVQLDIIEGERCAKSTWLGSGEMRGWGLLSHTQGSDEPFYSLLGMGRAKFFFKNRTHNSACIYIHILLLVFLNLCTFPTRGPVKYAHPSLETWHCGSLAPDSYPDHAVCQQLALLWGRPDSHPCILSPAGCNSCPFSPGSSCVL